MTIAPTFDELARADRLDVLVAGDTHGNDPWVASLIELAETLGLRVIIQVGDFGYWEPSADGTIFLDMAEDLLAAAGILLLFLDGNHENHAALRAQPLDDDGTAHIRPHIWYMPRGFRFTLAGHRVGVLGGAFSIDWRSRTPGCDWWPEERIEPEDVAALGAEPLDILLTHDMPAGVPISGKAQIELGDELASYEQRRFVAAAAAATTPRLLIHGHWHTRYAWSLAVPRPDGTRHTVRVEGLGGDGDATGGWAVLRIPSLTVIGRASMEQRVLRPLVADSTVPVSVSPVAEY